MAISIDEDGSGFVVRLIDEEGYPVAEMKITDLDVLILAQSAQQLRAAVLQRLQPPGGQYGAILSTEVVSVQVGETSLGESLLLTLGAPNGAESTYSLRPEVASYLSERLAIRTAALASRDLSQQKMT